MGIYDVSEYLTVLPPLIEDNKFYWTTKDRTVCLWHFGLNFVYLCDENLAGHGVKNENCIQENYHTIKKYIKLHPFLSLKIYFGRFISELFFSFSCSDQLHATWLQLSTMSHMATLKDLLPIYQLKRIGTFSIGVQEMFHILWRFFDCGHISFLLRETAT